MQVVEGLRDLDGMLAKAISRIRSSWADMGLRISAYKESEISPEVASNLAVDLAECKALPERGAYLKRTDRQTDRQTFNRKSY